MTKKTSTPKKAKKASTPKKAKKVVEKVSTPAVEVKPTYKVKLNESVKEVEGELVRVNGLERLRFTEGGCTYTVRLNPEDGLYHL